MALKLNVIPICVIKSDLIEIFKTGLTFIEIWAELVNNSCHGNYKRVSN